jgi:hypothetical protein
MLGRVAEWRGRFGFVLFWDETAKQFVRYFLPLNQIRMMAVDEPSQWNWVLFSPGPVPAYKLVNGRPILPLAKDAGIFETKEEALSAETLIAVGSQSSKGVSNE